MADSEKPTEVASLAEAGDVAPAQKPDAEMTDKAEDVEELDVTGTAAEAENPLFKDPSVLAKVLQQGLTANIVPVPKIVQRRIKALKKLQHEIVKCEAKFYEEVHLLECKYSSTYTPLFERRRNILTGAIEPTDSDCEWASEDEDEKLAEELKDKAKIEDEVANTETEETASVKGIPNFWLTIFRNVDMLNDMTQEHDEPILRHLTDLKVDFQETDPAGFTLQFVFEPNDYFTDAALTKRYELRMEPDSDDPLGYEGPEIVKCHGCQINWKPGKDVTVRLVKKKQKHKGRGTVRTVTKTVPNDSFFNFFAPPDEPEEGAEDAEDTQTLLSADYEIGHFLRERVVPRAVLYFTGEALEDDEDYEDSEDEEGDEDDEDDDENDPDAEGESGEQKPADCKSQ